MGEVIMCFSLFKKKEEVDIPVNPVLEMSRNDFVSVIQEKYTLSPISISDPLDSSLKLTTKEELDRVAPDLVYPADWYVDELWDCVVSPETCFGMGLFLADGSCNLRKGKFSGANWRIVGWKLDALERTKKAFESEWEDLVFPIKEYNSYKAGTSTNYGARRKTLYCLEVAPKNRNNNGTRGRFIEKFRKTAYYYWGDKKVPAGVLESPLSSKRAFLEGVIIGDGCISCEHTSITVHPNTTLSTLLKLMSDVRWDFSIGKEDGSDTFRVGINRRREGKGRILECLDGKGFVAHTDICKLANVNHTSCWRWLKELAEEELIIIEHPWNKRTNAKLVDRYNFCEDYGLQAQLDAGRKFKFSARLCLGDMDLGYHGFLMTLDSDLNLWSLEPNAGFPWAGVWFKPEENGYIPKKVFV